ncbi:MAG: fatty acid desaturase family protein [Methylophilaceae bacterium]
MSSKSILTSFKFADSFKDKEGVKLNVFAICFVLIGFWIGFACLFSSAWWINVIGMLLTLQTLITSAYLLHEFSHYSIFKSAELNKRWGVIMTWINGSCYSTYEEIRNKHMHHHVDRADVVSFDIKQFVMQMPKPFKLLITSLEWVYIPATEILMHILVIVLPFITPRWYHKRKRKTLVLLVRVSLFSIVGYYSVKALILYGVVYCMMLTMLRFADAYQHTYDAFIVADAGKKDDMFMADGKLRDAAYEQANTYSNLVSVRYPFLNLIFLNFSYHNAHHEKPIAPWYQLPALHEKLYGKIDTSAPVIPMRQLLKSFHRHRITRLVSDDYGTLEFKPNGADGFIGAVGVSFLTAI